MRRTWTWCAKSSPLSELAECLAALTTSKASANTYRSGRPLQRPHQHHNHLTQCQITTPKRSMKPNGNFARRKPRWKPSTLLSGWFPLPRAMTPGRHARSHALWPVRLAVANGRWLMPEPSTSVSPMTCSPALTEFGGGSVNSLASSRVAYLVVWHSLKTTESWLAQTPTELRVSLLRAERRASPMMPSESSVAIAFKRPGSWPKPSAGAFTGSMGTASQPGPALCRSKAPP